RRRQGAAGRGRTIPADDGNATLAPVVGRRPAGRLYPALQRAAAPRLTAASRLIRSRRASSFRHPSRQGAMDQDRIEALLARIADALDRLAPKHPPAANLA